MKYNIKYESELEMCRDLTALISGIIVPTKHKHIPEVPRSSGNNHSDMLFIKENGLMFIVEYKLNNLDGLIRQVQNDSYKVGIINQKLTEKQKEKVRYQKIFQYTGEDSELEVIAKKINHRRIPFGKNRFYANELMIYWWSYKHTGSSLEGGIKSGKRESFSQVYKRAIKNLLIEYKMQIDFEICYGLLGFYSFGTARKYYREVVAELKRATNNSEAT